MLGITRLHLPQPVNGKPVVELMWTNFVSRWFQRRDWTAFTLPLPWVVVILYWGIPSRRTRYHEFIHVSQDAGNANFLVSWARYLWEFLKAQSYHGNALEVEAYAKTAEAEKAGFPAWV